MSCLQLKLVHFSVAMSMKSCILLVLDILFMHFLFDIVLHAVVISPNAGAISTSAKFLYIFFLPVHPKYDQVYIYM